MKYRVRCIGKIIWDTVNGYTVAVGMSNGCGWTGVRTDHIECECYDIWTRYCQPLSPGPGCPRGINWPCPRCKGEVTGQLVQHRRVEGPCEMSKGWEMHGNPGVILCRQPGVERRDMPRLPAYPIACDDCYSAWKVNWRSRVRVSSGEPVERRDQYRQDPAQ